MPDRDRTLEGVLDRLYPIDPATGLRIYNPEGVRIPDLLGDDADDSVEPGKEEDNEDSEGRNDET